MDLLQRSAQFDLADHQAHRQRIKAEIEASKRLEPMFVWLASWSAHWKTYKRMMSLNSLRPNPGKPQHGSGQSDPPPIPADFPGLQRFNRVCRRANAGDVSAQAQLDHWLDDFPGLLSDATDFVAVAQAELIDFLSGGSEETKALLRARIDRQSTELQGMTRDDPLLKLYADVIMLAFFDLLRCSTAAARRIDTVKTATYWDRAAERAQKRWRQVSDAFRKVRPKGHQ
ncbi:hypothetical protein [Crateriforma spongiae]|uniref:hypothetical protein n=1 Tax=Crateriforma spongiae TaxID=2724528 RepID=UPI0039AF9E41